MTAPQDQADADSMMGSTKVDDYESGGFVESRRTVTKLQWKVEGWDMPELPKPQQTHLTFMVPSYAKSGVIRLPS